MLNKTLTLWLLSMGLSPLRAAATNPDHAQPSSVVSSVDVVAWGGGLILVLGIFLLCVWLVRKLSGMTVNRAGKLQMIGGLSLGLREKIILLQVGEKQLVLGVTPNRIETLLVLEGEDCLLKDNKALNPVFSQKLKDAIKASTNA